MIHIDPVTQQRIVYQEYSGDLEYDLVGDSAISQQVIGILGPTRNQQMNLGRSNQFFGTDPGLKGEKLPDLDITGNNKQTTNRIQIRRRVKV